MPRSRLAVGRAPWHPAAVCALGGGHPAPCAPGEGDTRHPKALAPSPAQRRGGFAAFVPPPPSLPGHGLGSSGLWCPVDGICTGICSKMGGNPKK